MDSVGSVGSRLTIGDIPLGVGNRTQAIVLAASHLVYQTIRPILRPAAIVLRS